jgi:quinol monooxygenase YgiN
VTHPSPTPSIGGSAASLLVVSRFRVDDADRSGFLLDAEAALAALTRQAGCLAGSLAQSTDDPTLLAIRTEWIGVGAYRRALSAFEVKVEAVPLLSRAVDEPSAYEVIRDWGPDGITSTGSGLAADAGEVSLGHAAGPDVQSVAPSSPPRMA